MQNGMYDDKHQVAGKVFLGTAIIEAGRGGIARVARLTARVLADMRQDLRIVSLLDDSPVEVAGISARLSKKSKLRFAAYCQLAALRHESFVFDSVGISRGLVSCNPLQRKVAIWMHGIEVWQNAKPEAISTLRRADLLLANSRYSLSRHEALYGARPQAMVCPLATEDDLPMPDRPPRRGPPTVLIVGRIDVSEAYKGHSELIRSWPDVIAEIPDARLLIAGGGAGLPALKQEAARSPAAHAISCLGFIPEAEIDSVWSEADVFAMPSRKEGFGLVYIEAMRRKLPVVASVHDAGAEVNVHGKTGLNVDLDRRGDLPRALIELLRSKELATRMGAEGFDRWRSEYRYGAFAKRLAPILEEFLDPAAQRPGTRRRR